MTNIAYAELCELRPFFSTTFNHLRFMNPRAAPSGIEGPAFTRSQLDLSQDPSSCHTSGLPGALGGTGIGSSGGAALGSHSLDESMPSAFGSSLESRPSDNNDDEGELGVAAWGAS